MNDRHLIGFENMKAQDGQVLPTSIEYEKKTIPGFLNRAARDFPEKTAIYQHGYKMTYSRLQDMVDTLSCNLKKFGIKKGRRVAIALSNSIPCAVSYLAVLKAGGVAVMNPPETEIHDLERRLKDTQCKVAIVSDSMVNSLVSLRSRMRLDWIIYVTPDDFNYSRKPGLFTRLFRRNRKDSPWVKPARNLYSWTDLMEEKSLVVGEEALTFQDDALIHYFGAGHGPEYGVILNHGNLSMQVQQINSRFPSLKKNHERIFGAFPLSHPFGISMGVNWSVFNAWELVVDPREGYEHMAATIKDARPSVAIMHSRSMAAMAELREIRRIPVGAMVCCFSGDGPLSRKTVRFFEERSEASIVECYGPLETSGVTHIQPVTSLSKKEGSIGIPLPDTECWVVDFMDPDREVSCEHPGELLIKGPQVMAGYVRRGNGHHQVIDNGWLRTGDVVYVDRDGYFYPVDRVSDTIITDGHPVYPREIDRIVHKHPKVSDACAVGIPNEQKGEMIKLFVSLKDGEKLSPEELINFCKDKIDPYKWPSQVEIRDHLPKTVVGCVQRQKLREEERMPSH